MQSEIDHLDAEELLHLGIRASQNNLHEDAIVYLKKSLDKQESANAHFMLAAEHAGLNLYDKALEGMQKAVTINPELWIAHFQHGLLYATLGNAEQAIACWQPLEKLEPKDPLLLFKTGLSHILNNDLEAGKTIIEEGINNNQTNLPLNNDMQKVLHDIESKLNDSVAPSNEAPKNNLNEELLNNYKTED